MPNHISFEDRAYSTLKNSALFGGLEEKILKEMIAECTPITWNKAETIDYKMAEEYLFIIISGRLKITHLDPKSGRSLGLFLKHENDIFDIVTFLDAKEHVVFPIALDKMEVLRIPIGRAREWLTEYPEFNAAFLPYLADKMIELESLITSLIFDDTTTRLSKLILKHTLPEKNDCHHPVKLINNLSHESLADLIGSVRSVVSTQMHKLNDEGVIISKRGHLAVKNLEKLIKKIDS